MFLSLLHGDHAFSTLRPAVEHMWQVRGGKRVLDTWNEVEFTELNNVEDEFIAVDCLTMNTEADGFLVSAYAREVLAPLLVEAAQFLPVRVLGRRYWWLNCIASLDALDLDNTDADWSTVRGDWGSFSWISTTRRLMFHPNRLRHAPALFRVPEYPQGVFFAQDSLRTMINDYKLTGFKFVNVWSMKLGGVRYPDGIESSSMFTETSIEKARDRRRIAREILSFRPQ